MAISWSTNTKTCICFKRTSSPLPCAIINDNGLHIVNSDNNVGGSLLHLQKKRSDQRGVVYRYQKNTAVIAVLKVTILCTLVLFNTAVSPGGIDGQSTIYLPSFNFLCNKLKSSRVCCNVIPLSNTRRSPFIEMYEIFLT